MHINNGIKIMEIKPQVYINNFDKLDKKLYLAVMLKII
jgi:hypothetical protein